MIGFDAGAAVPSHGSRLNCGKSCGRGGGCPRGRDPPQKAGVEAPPQTLHKMHSTDTQLTTPETYLITCCLIKIEISEWPQGQKT